MRLILREGFDHISKANAKRRGYHGPTLNGIEAVVKDEYIVFKDDASFDAASLATGWPIDNDYPRTLHMCRHEQTQALLLWNQYTSEAEFYYHEELQDV
jgi:hypothetical protein